MELTEEHKNRALEIFTSFVEIQKEIEENQQRLNNLSQVQKTLIKKIEQIRQSEKEWISKISIELDVEPNDLHKEVAQYVLAEVNKVKKFHKN